MKRRAMHKISFILLLLLFIASSNAQQKNTIYFANQTIAVQQQNDSIIFYNSEGYIRKIISLKNKKATPYGLPQEVQEIIYKGEIPTDICVSEESFPTYLYTQKYENRGVVICFQQYYYDSLHLKNGFTELCPDDLNDGDILHEKQYKYNKYGLLTQADNCINYYNNLGQLLKKEYKNTKLGTIVRTITYEYQNGKIINSNISSNSEKSTRSYVYNSKGMLIEIIKNNKSKIVLEYNSNDKIVQVSLVNTWRNKTYKTLRLNYIYDVYDRICKVQTYQNGFLDKSYAFKYNAKGSLIKKTINGQLIASYQYNKNGTLISILSNEKWGADKKIVKYE